MSLNVEKQPPVLPPFGYPPFSLGLNEDPEYYIRNHLNLYEYIWLNNGISYWFYPTAVSNDTCAGYAWYHSQFIPVELKFSDIHTIY